MSDKPKQSADDHIKEHLLNTFNNVDMGEWPEGRDDQILLLMKFMALMMRQYGFVMQSLDKSEVYMMQKEILRRHLKELREEDRWKTTYDDAEPAGQ